MDILTPLKYIFLYFVGLFGLYLVVRVCGAAIVRTIYDFKRKYKSNNNQGGVTDGKKE